MPPTRQEARAWWRANAEDTVLDWWCLKNKATIGDHRDDWEAWKTSWRANQSPPWDNIIEPYFEHHRTHALRNRHSEDEFQWWAGGYSVLTKRSAACRCQAIDRRLRLGQSPPIFMRLKRQCEAHQALTPEHAWQACEAESQRLGTVQEMLRARLTDDDVFPTWQFVDGPGDERILELIGADPAVAADIQAMIDLIFGPGLVRFA